MPSSNECKWSRGGSNKSLLTSDRDHSKLVPVLVFGSGLTALGVIRCFGRAGIPVYCMSIDADLISRSRWFKRLGQPSLTIANSIGCLAFLKSLPVDKAVLMPCSDEWAVALSRLPDEACMQFACCLSHPDVLETIADKGKFAACLETHDIPRPTTMLIDSEESFAKVGLESNADYFLKPHDSQRFFARYGKKAFRVQNRQQAIESFRQFKRDGFAVLLQEYIPGGSDQHYFIDGFVDCNGRVKSFFARRRLRMFPPDFGNSSHMVSVSLDSVNAAVRSLTKLLEGIGFRGIFSAEFKYDHRDGEFKVIEINARPWWFVGFADDCGVPVCLQAYQDALGEPVNAVPDYLTGVPFVHAYYDFHACRLQYTEGRLGVAQWLKTWLQARYPIFALDDPLPAIDTFARRIYGYFSKRLTAAKSSRT